MKFHDKLKMLMDEYIHLVYGVTRKFPKEEIFGTTSQLRRASLSVVLNYIEGYARATELSYINFLRISYASLQESKYLLDFSYKENFLSAEDFKKLNALAEEVGAMLYSTIKNKTKHM